MPPSPHGLPDSEHRPRRVAPSQNKRGRARGHDPKRRIGGIASLRSRTLAAVYVELGRAIYRSYAKFAAGQVATARKNGRIVAPSGWCRRCRHLPATVHDHRNYHRALTVQAVCDPCNLTLPPAVVDVATVMEHVRLGRHVEAQKSARDRNGAPMRGPRSPRR